MQELADELVESWINGNLSTVIAEVIKPWKNGSVRAALLSALIFSQLGAGERPVFLRMLKDAL